MPLDPPTPSAPPAHPQPRLTGPIREVLLRRFRDPEEAAAVRRLGHLLLDLVNEAGRHGPEDARSTIRPVLLAVTRDLLADASNLTEIADECGWNRELPQDEAELAGRVEAWAVVRYLALKYAVRDQEVMGALFIDVRHRLVGEGEIYRGTLVRTSVEPRDRLPLQISRSPISRCRTSTYSAPITSCPSVD